MMVEIAVELLLTLPTALNVNVVTLADAMQQQMEEMEVMKLNLFNKDVNILKEMRFSIK